jgi:hypothetical protein
MSVKIINADSNGMVFLHCPFCDKSRRESVANLPSNVPFKVDCPCGGTYESMIEVRKVFRKSMAFKVLILRIDPPGSGFSETVVINNISLGGCGFQASAKHGFQIGNIIQIRFKTDNVVKPIIWKEAAVRVVNDCYIGCEFAPTAGGMDVDFGFYFRKL